MRQSRHLRRRRAGQPHVVSGAAATAIAVGCCDGCGRAIVGGVIRGHLQHKVLFLFTLIMATSPTAGPVPQRVTTHGRHALRRGTGLGFFVVVAVLTHQQRDHSIAQWGGEYLVLEGRPAFALHRVADAARQGAMSAVPAVRLVEGLGPGVAQARADLDVVVRRHQVGLLVALVLDAQVIGQAAMAVECSTCVRQEFDWNIERDLFQE